jgi:hypothetical protein
LNGDWREAIDVLAASALAAQIGPKGYELRVAILHRFYGRYHSYRAIAQSFSVGDAPIDDGTIARQGKDMKAWLGVRESGDSGDAEGIEPQALARATELLHDAELLEA